MKANHQSVAVEGTPPAVKMGADNMNTTTTCKGTDKNVKPDGSPPAIVMGIKTDATYSKDSGIKGKGKADNLDGTPLANMPVPAIPKFNVANKLDKDKTIPVATPRALPTLTSETMIPIFPATPRSKVVKKVGLSKSKHHVLSHTQKI